MHLLLFTQIVDRDDSALGFFHQWIEEFARRCEKVYVICLREGVHALPKNVVVLSLGKERMRGKTLCVFPRIRYLCRFFFYVWKYRKDYDAVFVHMNQIYVLLGAALWRLWGKRVGLWYAHGAVSFSLRLAEIGADMIITSTTRGFRLASKKIHIVGQGIDTKQFVPCAQSYDPESIRIIYIGRIAPIKQCEILIEATGLLHARGEKVLVTFVGDSTAPGTSEYCASLKEKIRTLKIGDSVTFVGGVHHGDVPRYLCATDVFVNPSRTGSLDKAGLEAIAAGVPLITCNEAFAEVFGTYADRLMFPPGDAGALADRIVAVHHAYDRPQIIDVLTTNVTQEHSLEKLIPRILALYT